MDKIEKIRQEIERMKRNAESAKKEWNDGNYNQNAFAEDCRIKSFDKLLAFIDTLPDENNPEPYNPVYDEAYLNEKIAKASKTWEGVDVDKCINEVRDREPDKGLDVTDFCKPIDPGIAQCVADHWWEMLGEDEKPVPNDLSEEPNKSLEEEMNPSGSSEIPKDLEEAAEDFVWEVMEEDYDGPSELCRKLRPSSKISDYYDALAEFFKAGAKWQEQQMMDEWLKDRDGCFWNGVSEGTKAMEKQMMKDAVEGVICATITGTNAISFLSPLPKELTAGDKVRIIVLKAEEE